MFWSYSSSKLRGQLGEIEELRRERMVKVMDVVLIQAFQLFVAQVLRQLLKRSTLKSESSH
jgi:hypothetical protein